MMVVIVVGNGDGNNGDGWALARVFLIAAFDASMTNCQNYSALVWNLWEAPSIMMTFYKVDDYGEDEDDDDDNDEDEMIKKLRYFI